MRSARLGESGRSILVLAVLVGLGVRVAGQTADKVELIEKAVVGDQYRVELGLQLNGQIHIKNGDKTINLKLSATAIHRFPERVLSVEEDRPTRVARHYDEAQAVITVQGEARKRSLRPDRRFQVAQRSGGDTVTYSPVGPLTREELDLTGEHLDVTMLHGLLPGRAVSVKENWTVPNAAAQALAGFDGLVAHELRCTLLKLDEREARVSFQGPMNGISRGAEVKLSVEGHYVFDRKLARIVALEWKQDDERGQGPVTPGSKTQSVITMKRVFGGGPAEALLDGVVATVPAGPGPGHLLLSYREPKGRCEFHHDRSWHLIAQNDRQIVLRALERGELVGQLNVTPWARAKPGEHLTPEELRKHIDDSPGFEVDQVLQSGPLPADEGLWVYRLSVVGTADEVRLMQNYFAVADKQGNQAVFTFTTEVPLAEKFAQRDLSIIGTVSFPR